MQLRVDKPGGSWSLISLVEEWWMQPRPLKFYIIIKVKELDWYFVPGTSVFYMVEKLVIYRFIRVNMGKHVCNYVIRPFYVFYVKSCVMCGYYKPNISQSQC